MRENNTQYIPEETIDLRELLNVLLKRKKLIIVLTAAMTLLAVLYAFVIATPVYEVKAMIEVGQIDAKPIDKIKNIQQKLSYEYQINTRGKHKELPRVTRISVPKGSDSLISLTTQAHSNEEAQHYIGSVIANIESQYKKKTDAYIANQKDLIALTRQSIDENRKSLEEMQKEISDYSQRIISLKREDAALAGIYALQIGQKQTELQRLKQYITQLKNKEQELKLSITPLVIKATHIVGEPEVLDAPVKPKKALIVIVAFITGLMLSVFLAFFLEFIQGFKEEK